MSLTNKKRKAATAVASLTGDGDGGAAAVGAVLGDDPNVLIHRSSNNGNGGAADTSNGNSNKRRLDVYVPVHVPTDRTTLHQQVGYTPMTLQDIHDRVQDLCRRLPHVPESGFVLEGEEVEEITTTGVAPKQQQPPPESADTSSTHSSSPSNNSEVDPALAAAAVGVTTTAKAAATTTTRAASPTLPQATLACPYDKEAIRSWATAVQIVLEEFHLLIACVSPATYVWGTDRSGAADQNLSLLSAELMRSQEQILSRVTPRLNDVLAPVVTLVTDKTVTRKLINNKGETNHNDDTNNNNNNNVDADGMITTDIKQNYFITTLEDPDYANLCFCIVARNAVLLRQVILANFDKLMQSIQDYLSAQHKDSQHDARGFVY